MHPKRELEHEAVVVGAVLGVGAVGFDLGLQAVMKALPAQGAPARGVGVIGQNQRGGVEGGRFAEEVVVVLGAGIEQGGGNPRGVGGDGASEGGEACGGGFGRIRERAVRVGEGDQA